MQMKSQAPGGPGTGLCGGSQAGQYDRPCWSLLPYDVRLSTTAPSIASSDLLFFIPLPGKIGAQCFRLTTPVKNQGRGFKTPPPINFEQEGSQRHGNGGRETRDGRIRRCREGSPLVRMPGSPGAPPSCFATVRRLRARLDRASRHKRYYATLLL